MKLWIDDCRPAPPGYYWVKSVNEAKRVIVDPVIQYRFKGIEIIDIDQGYSCLVYLGENDCFKTIKTYDEVVAIIKQELRENDRQQAENEQLKRNLSQCENGYSQELHLARFKIE